MLRLRGTPLSLDSLNLPEGIRLLPTELEVVDDFLDDERFLLPFTTLSRTTMGRPSTPVEQYLRLMYLKHRQGIGYENLTKAVRENLHWRVFCRIPFDKPVPHYTTLLRWAHDYGEDTIRTINKELVKKFAEWEPLCVEHGASGF